MATIIQSYYLVFMLSSRCEVIEIYMFGEIFRVFLLKMIRYYPTNHWLVHANLIQIMVRVCIPKPLKDIINKIRNTIMLGFLSNDSSLRKTLKERKSLTINFGVPSVSMLPDGISVRIVKRVKINYVLACILYLPKVLSIINIKD